MNRHDKASKSLLALALLLFVGGMAAANALTPDRTFSDSENRVLEPLPRFSLRGLLSGTFMSDYEQYVADQFAFRDAWIGIKTDADRALGKKDSNGVYLGRDGYLIQQYASPPDSELTERVQAIHSFDDATPDLRKYVLLAPTAAALLKDKLPAYAPVGDERADLNRIRRSLRPDIRFVDVYPALEADRGGQLFYRTDHHWTTRGAYDAYRELCRQMGLVPLGADAFEIRQATDRFYGSLYSKSGFRHVQPDRIDLYLPKEASRVKVEYVDEGVAADSLYALDNLRKKDKYAVFLNGNHALIRITTENPEGKKLLVVKDSYANSLIPFLTAHFSEIDVVDLRYFDDSLTRLVQERSIHDLLILQNIETFFEDPSILNLTEE